MARKPMQTPPSDMVGAPPTPAMADTLSQVLAKIDTLERAIVLMSELVQLPRVTQHVTTPEEAERISRMVADKIAAGLVTTATAMDRLREAVETVPNKLGTMGNALVREIKTVREALDEQLKELREEAEVQMQGTANLAQNEVARVASSMKIWMEDLKSKNRSAVETIKTELTASTAAAEKVHGKIGQTAAALEAIMDGIDYANPALTVNTERRLRRFARDTGLMSSAATVAALTLVNLLIRTLGLH